MRRYVAFAACMSLLLMVWPLRWATAVPPGPSSRPGGNTGVPAAAPAQAPGEFNLAAGVQERAPEVAGRGPGAANSAPALLSAAQAESLARTLLPIPASLPVRDSSYRPENPYRPVWSLVFALSEPGSRTGEFHVDLDARTGQVSRYLTTAPLAETPALAPLDSDQPAAGRSRFTYDEGRKLTEDLLRRLAYREAPLLQLTPQPPLSTVFRYPFVRMEQGVPVSSLGQDEGAVILLDAATGGLRSYELRWSESITFPTATPAITATQATDLWLNKVGFELRYRLHRSQESAPPATATLEYGPASREQAVYVDGQTGDLVAGTDLLVPIVPPQPVVLKPAATAAVRFSPLGETEAVDFVRRHLPVPAGQGPLARLQTDSTGAALWVLEWSATEEEEQRAGSMRVTVDAQRGLLLQFTRLQPLTAPGGPQLTRRQALPKAVDFLESLPPAPWSLRYVPEPESAADPYAITDFVMPAYIFTFEPLINGMPVSPAAVRVWVTADGEVEGYQVDEALRIAYPPASGVLRPDEIAGAFARAGGKLEPYYQVSVTTRAATLLYRAQGPAGLLLHPYTGAPIDEEGRDLSYLLQPPRDLDQHWAGPEINLAIALKLILPREGRFGPDQPLSRREAATLLVSFGREAGESLQQPHAQPAATAALLLEAEPSRLPDGPISRGEFAVMLARFLGLSEIAAVRTHMQLPFTDSTAIPAAWRNHVALAAGTGLMVGYADNSWRPNAPLTRAMAAVVISRITRGWLTGSVSS